MARVSMHPIVESTVAIMFFGTPLKESSTPVKAIFKALGLQSDDALLNELGYSDSHLAHCRYKFAKIWDVNPLKVKAFYEMTQHNGTFVSQTAP